MRALRLAVVVAAFVSIGAAFAGEPTAEVLAKQVEVLLAEQVPPRGPGVVVLVAKGDVVLVRTARGMASLELGVPLSPDHAFRIGSLTKQFSASALLRQVDAQKVKLSDPLSTLAPSYPNGANITLAQLLNHTAGVKSYTTMPGYMSNPVRRDLSTDEMIEVFSKQPPDFAPGAGWLYSNSGYVLVGEAIEAITKRPWHEEVHAMVTSVGMTSTVYGDTTAVVHGMAEGYSTSPDGHVNQADFLSMTQPHAAGALVSTADDLMRWNLALHGGRVLLADTYKRMVTPEGQPAEKANYGFGITRATIRGRPASAHGGNIFGFGAYLIWLPAERLSVVVLRNSDGSGADPATVARLTAAFALGDPYPGGEAMKPTAKDVSGLSGRWKSAESPDEITVKVVDDGLKVQMGPRAPKALRFVGNGRFVSVRGLDRLEFQGGRVKWSANGEGQGVAWQRVGDLPADRKEIKLTAAQKEAVLGTYRTPYLSIRIFEDAGSGLSAEISGQPPMPLLAETPRRLFTRDQETVIEFDGTEGSAAAATLKQGRQVLKLTR